MVAYGASGAEKLIAYVSPANAGARAKPNA